MGFMTVGYDWTESSSYGVMRGFSIQFALTPFETIKNRQQCNPKPCYLIAREIIQKEGYLALYRGFPPKLVQTCFKQAWIWPVITGEIFKEWNLPKLTEQAAIGLTIASVDSTLGVIFEKSRIRSNVSGTTEFCLRINWKEYTANWKKLAMHWPPGLVLQQFFRDLNRKSPDQSLTLPQIAITGIETAIPISPFTNYFDTRNTLIQAGRPLPENLLFYSFRVLPIHILMLTIHTTTAIFFLEKLQK
jgi:hypothetical protein